MARKKVEEVKQPKNTFTCLSCGKSIIADNYYNTYSNLYNKSIMDGNKKVPVCKACLLRKYEEILAETQVVGKAIYTMCGFLDIAFKKAAFDMAERTKTDNLLGVYIRLINSRKEFNGLSFADSDPIDGMFNSDDQIIQFRRKWGDGFSYEEYLNLEDRYDKLIQEKGEPDFAKSDAYRKFILASVVYDREISSTTATDRNSATNNYFKALQAAGLNGKELSKEEKDLSAGEIIMKFEEHSPILKLEEHKDVDRFTDVKDAIVKHLNRIFGRS